MALGSGAAGAMYFDALAEWRRPERSQSATGPERALVWVQELVTVLDGHGGLR